MVVSKSCQSTSQYTRNRKHACHVLDISIPPPISPRFSVPHPLVLTGEPQIL